MVNVDGGLKSARVVNDENLKGAQIKQLCMHSVKLYCLHEKNKWNDQPAQWPS